MPMDMGEKIKRRRIQLGIDADELANRIGKSRATIYRYENGDIENMPTTILEPLAKILNTTPAYLMGWDEDEKHPAYLMGRYENTMNHIYCIKLKLNDSAIESTVQAISKHEAIGKTLEIVPMATYKDIIEIKEDT